MNDALSWVVRCPMCGIDLLSMSNITSPLFIEEALQNVKLSCSCGGDVQWITRAALSGDETK